MRRVVLSFATVVAGCGGGRSPEATPDAAASPDAVAIDAAAPARRELGVEVNQPAGFDQGQEIERVKPFGVSAVQLTIPWSALEPAGHGFDPNEVGLLKFGMDYYHQHGVHVLLSIPAVDTTALLLPSDLAGQKLDAPAVIARAEALVTEVLAQCGPELEYLVLSNEVDINLADGAPTWSELDAMIAAMAARAHALRPDVRTGVSVTAGALVTPNADAIAALAANDVAFVTYYDAGNFGTMSSAGVGADIAAIVAATTRPVVFKEFGYATGDLIGGSDAGQAQFVTDTFAAWDAHADRIPFLMYSRMFDTDMPTCVSEAAGYGDPDDQPFIQFLCTLGLRSYADEAKPAWSTFTAAAQARVWNATP